MKNSAYNALTDEQLAEIDGLCDQFEKELANGKSPAIEVFLSKAQKPAQKVLLAELLDIEIEHRFQKGEQVKLEEYVDQFPHRAKLITRLFDRESATQCAVAGRNKQIGDVPSELGNFELIEEIGSGGMGVVWLAEQIQPVKRRVALKLIKPELVSPNVLARFEAEKQALALMNHVNIARVLDAGTTGDDRPFIAMEFVDGIPITSYCDDKKLTVDERLELFVSVCKAVQHAHQKGIIHRDLKPSNVLVTEIDGEAVPKVIDFGLAKTVEQNLELVDEKTLTEFGHVVGTVQYMSPEQAELTGKDKKDLDTRTDIYSLGILLYELLTGSTPLGKQELEQNALLKLLTMIREHDPPRPSYRLSSASNKLTSTVSDLRKMNPVRLKRILQGELDWVVMKALEKDRNRRYQSAGDFAQDLSNFLTGKAVVARPPSAWYQLRKFANRNRGLVASILAVCFVLLAGIVGTSYGLFQANQKAAVATANEKQAWKEKEKARQNEDRAVQAEIKATHESLKAQDAEAESKFQLAIARFEAGRAAEARTLLHQIPTKYRDNFEWHYCHRRFNGAFVTGYGHTRGIQKVAFSPDGSRVASASLDETIKLWDAESGEELATLAGHQGGASSLAFHPDGSVLATAGNDGMIRFWDLNTNEEIRSIGDQSSRVNCVAIHPKGNLVVAAYGDGNVMLWDFMTGENVAIFQGHQGSVFGVAFSPDGNRVASVGGDRMIRIWDTLAKTKIAEFTKHRIQLESVAFSPDGTRLVATTYSNVSVWDAKTWQFIQKTGEHDGPVYSVAFSPDSAQFVTAGADSSIKLWDSRSGLLIKTLAGHANKVRGVAFNHNGTRLVSGSDDKTIKVWDMLDQDAIVLRGPRDAKCVAFDNDGRLLAHAAATGDIFLRNAHTGELLFNLKGHIEGVSGVAFGPEGERLASSGDDGTVRVWDTRSGEELAILRGHTHWVRGIAYSSDGRHIASASWDGTLRLWDAQTLEPAAILKGHRGGLYCVAFSPDGSKVASADNASTVKIWDVRSGKEIRTLQLPMLQRSVAFSPDGLRLATGGYDAKVGVWEVETGKLIWVASHPGAIFTVAFCPDGKRIAVSGTDKKVNILDTQTGKEVMTLSSGSGGCYEVAFSRDGTRLAGANSTGNIRIWDAPRSHETITLGAHARDLNRVAINSEGTRLFSESEGEKRIWDVANRIELTDADWEPPANGALSDFDGRWLVTADSSNVVLVDREYNKTPLEFGRRQSRSGFDPRWHLNKARNAASRSNWFAAVFHFAYLRENDPDSIEYYFGLQSSYRWLLNHDSADSEELTHVKNDAANTHGTYFAQLKKQIASTLPITPLKSADASNPSDNLDGAKRDQSSNHSLYFDGASYADLDPSTFHQNAFTIEGWIKTGHPHSNKATPTNLQHVVFSLKAGLNSAMAAEVFKDGRLRVIHRNPPSHFGGINLLSETKVNDGRWHHFAIVRDADKKLRVYVDGALEATSQEDAVDFGDVSFELVLGMNHAKTPRYFIGLMDEFRLWNVARTRDEISKDMKVPVKGNSNGLVARYSFDLTDLNSEPGLNESSSVVLPPIVQRALQLPLSEGIEEGN